MTKEFLREGSKMLEYISAPEAAKKWGISERRVQRLCEDARIPGISKIGYMWLIPKAADKPVDKRQKQKKGGEKL
jgi:hypothetical protein